MSSYACVPEPFHSVTLQPPHTEPRKGYGTAALETECAMVARTDSGRNEQLNRSSFALGQLVGAGVLDRHDVERRLFSAAEASGYVKKDGASAAWSTIRSGLDKGARVPRDVPPRSSDASEQVMHAGPGANVLRLAAARTAPVLGADDVPAWTPPDGKGKPRFAVNGRDGPERLERELRRHSYRRGSKVVRVKVKLAAGNWLDFYRVMRPSDGVEGWQPRKPDGFRPTPYIGPAEAGDPFDPEHQGEMLFWPEGEKDVDSLQALGLFAFTFGGSNDVPKCADLLRERNLVVLADNDEPGLKSAARKIEMARGVARAARVVTFTELPRGQDVSDWLAQGGTVEALHDRIATVRDALRPVPVIEATPFRWIDPSSIEPRGWLYGWHYIRKFVSCTVSPGGIGKSTLAIAEALSIASGRALLRVNPVERVAVWYWNGEDPQDELERRVMAAVALHGLAPMDIDGRLFVDTGRTKPIIVAQQTKDGVTIAKPIVEAMKDTIRANRIGLVIIDPFVSSHRVTENDNGAIEAVATIWAQIADETNCSIELIHHSRKTGGAEVTVEDGRGAVALLNKARSARAINAMTEDEAEEVGVETAGSISGILPGNPTSLRRAINRHG